MHADKVAGGLLRGKKRHQANDIAQKTSAREVESAIEIIMQKPERQVYRRDWFAILDFLPGRQECLPHREWRALAGPGRQE